MLSTALNKSLVEKLKQIAGSQGVLTDPKRTRRYRTGFRFGNGSAIAVVLPDSLVVQWRVLNACVDAGVAVIMQAANTGLTGGSTPDGDDYERGVVIINTMRMKTIHIIKNGEQVICLPGATLDQLEHLLKPLGREPHSVIGSSCLGASIFGGVCNNSGGALLQRGPVYTEMALFAQVDEEGQLRLINHLGVALGNEPEQICENLERRNYREADVSYNGRRGSDEDYVKHVRDIDADTPARFNADPKRLYEASGCAGKLILFAVRLDTFAAQVDPVIFYIGTNEPDALEDIRRHMLQKFAVLPILAEYMHRDAFDVAEKYGKDTFLMIRMLGTRRLPAFFALKNALDRMFSKVKFLPSNLSDRILQAASSVLPGHLPSRIKAFRERFEHHLILSFAAPAACEARDFLEAFFASGRGEYVACTKSEGDAALLHRFAAAGAAVRYRTMHRRTVEDIVALDIALRRNERKWFEELPPDIDQAILKKLYYGHFFCHVLHQDYIVRAGNNCEALEHKMWVLLDQRGAEYPAEHNVGHLYPAKPALAAFYRELDPCNCFNPGIGRTSKRRNWIADQPLSSNACQSKLLQ